MSTYNMNVKDKSNKIFKFTKTIVAGTTGATTQFDMNGDSEVGYKIEKGRYYNLKYSMIVLDSDDFTYNAQAIELGDLIYPDEYLLRYAFSSIPNTDMFTPDTGWFNWSTGFTNSTNTEVIRLRLKIINTDELTIYCDTNTFTTDMKVIFLLHEIENIRVIDLFQDENILMVDYSEV